MQRWVMACIFYVFVLNSQALLAENRKIVQGIDENKCHYKVSICAIFQNEAPYLQEWIEYHKMIGVDHFYLYNNNSQDDYVTVLKPYIEEGVVELNDWPSAWNAHLPEVQKEVYNDCIAQCTGQTLWLAVIDIDEFIVPVIHKNLKDFLKVYDRNQKIGGVLINWQIYGTSWLAMIPQDKLLIESLTYKAAWNHPWNKNVKTICKPHKVQKYFVHGAKYKAGYHDVTPNGKGGPNQLIQVDRIRLNHYWTRAEDFFFGIKVPRRELFLRRPYTADEISKMLTDFNAHEDTVMDKFVPTLREKIFKKTPHIP